MDGNFWTDVSLLQRIRRLVKLNATFVVAFFLAFIYGCSNGVALSGEVGDTAILPPLIKSFSLQRQRQFAVPFNSKFYIPTPVWTFQQERVNPQELTAQLAQSISSRFPNVMSSGAIQDVTESIKQARFNKANFVLYIRPNDWHQRSEDNPSAPHQLTCSSTNSWSLTPNADDLVKSEEACRKVHNVSVDNARANLTVWLIDAPTGQVIDLISIESQSGLLPISEGSTAALLRGPFNDLARRLAPTN